MVKKVLITGITGSGGSYLAEYLLENISNLEIHGTSRWHSTSSLKNIHSFFKKITIHECDLNDFSSIIRVLSSVKPNIIFHLASHANVRSSFDTPLSVLENNIRGTANLLESIRYLQINPTVQICSTSEVYGKVNPDDIPIDERCPLKPVSPYAVSKTTQDLLSYTYYLNYGMKIVITRMFSYINPKREDLFASSFAKQVAQIENGQRKYLVHGNLSSIRTLIDVRDAMEAYWIAAKKGKVGEIYNIGGNKVIKVGDFLRLLIRQAKCPIKIRLDKNLLRPTDVTLQIPDTKKFRRHTGWKPKYKFEDSVTFLLDYWRKNVSNSPN